MNLLDVVNYKNWSNLDNTNLDLKKEDMNNLILNKIIRKPFRKQRLSDKGKNEILNAINKNILENKPLNITLLFGGYKHFWNSDSPSIDWAELFFIDHIIQWLKPILKEYKPGVIFTFASEDIILDVMNGYKKEDLDFYSKSFLILLKNIKKYFPKNLKIEYLRMGKDIYDGNLVKKEVLEGVENRIIEFKKKDTDFQERYLYRSERNLNISNITINDRIRSKMIEDYFYEIEEKYAGDFFSEDKIYITLTWGRSKEENIFEWLSIGSTRSTLVDFWIGKGILEKREDRFIKKIISQTQFEKIKDNLKKYNIDGNIIGLDIFNKIKINYIN